MSLRDLIDAFKVKHVERRSRGVMLQVVQNSKVMLFKLDGATNSKFDKRTIYTGGFWDYFIPLVYAYKSPRILMIGLGLGTTNYQLHSLFGSRLKIDVVELDREVVKLAREYAPRKIRDRIYIGDGDAFVVKTQKRYDIIILDAYGKGARIPAQFYSEKFVRNAFRVLKPEGTLAINYAMHPYGLIRFIGYRRRLRRLFHVYTIKTDRSGSMQIIICSKKFGKERLLGMIRARMKPDMKNGKLLKGYQAMRSF